MRQQVPVFQVDGPEGISWYTKECMKVSGSIVTPLGFSISLAGALKTNGKLSEERAEDTDCDGSPLPEDFTEVRIRPRETL